MSLDQPTNQPTGDRYVSVRLTLPHKEIYKVRDQLVHDVESYIIYPHLGKDGKNPHFHVCIPIIIGDDDVKSALRKICEKYRKRAVSIAGSGNGKVMCKACDNGVSEFVAYVKHEVGEVYLNGFTDEWFSSIKAKDYKNIGGYMDPVVKRQKVKDDQFYQITYSNMEKVCLRYRAQNGIKSCRLEDTLEHMHQHGWRLQVTVLKQGIPSTIFDQFEAACEGKTAYRASKFVMMRTLEKWKEST